MPSPPRIEPRAVLSRSPLLRGLDAQWIDVLAADAVIVRFDKGQFIFRQGAECPGLYCVHSGLVRVLQTSPGGKEMVLHFAEPGRTFGEVALLGNFPLPADAQAVEDTVCALVPERSFRAALQRHHELALGLLSGMAIWVRHVIELVEDLVLRDAAGRVARHLLDASAGEGRSFQLPMLKRDLAAHLNLTQETLSRTLRRLAARGLIDQPSPNELRVLDAEGLAKAVQGVLTEED